MDHIEPLKDPSDPRELCFACFFKFLETDLDDLADASAAIAAECDRDREFWESVSETIRKASAWQEPK